MMTHRLNIARSGSRVITPAELAGLKPIEARVVRVSARPLPRAQRRRRRQRTWPVVLFALVMLLAGLSFAVPLMVQVVSR